MQEQPNVQAGLEVAYQVASQQRLGVDRAQRLPSSLDLDFPAHLSPMFILGQWCSKMALRSYLWLPTGRQGTAWVGLGLKGNFDEAMITSSTREQVNQKP